MIVVNTIILMIFKIWQDTCVLTWLILSSFFPSDYIKKDYAHINFPSHITDNLFTTNTLVLKDYKTRRHVFFFFLAVEGNLQPSPKKTDFVRDVLFI